MSRLTQLDDIFFQVEMHPVFANIKGGGSERHLPIRDKMAIVNAKTSNVLGIVGRGYRLVTNREALELAIQCCREVFPETNPGEWDVKTVDAPATAGFCHIDLAHNSTALDFTCLPAADRPEVFGPFIRVTNSYNGRRALAFDIGFYRKVCSNGLILPDLIIRFKFVHSRIEIGETIQFNVQHDRLNKLKTSFGDFLGSLHECAVSREEFGPLIRGVLSLRQPKGLNLDWRFIEDWEKLSVHLSKLEARYSAELGDNAYAAFNAITEFASHPPSNRCVHRDRNSLQKLAGTWINQFSQQCRQPGFSLGVYLENLSNSTAETMSRN